MAIYLILSAIFLQHDSCCFVYHVQVDAQSHTVRGGDDAQSHSYDHDDAATTAHDDGEAELQTIDEDCDLEGFAGKACGKDKHHTKGDRSRKGVPEEFAGISPTLPDGRRVCFSFNLNGCPMAEAGGSCKRVGCRAQGATTSAGSADLADCP